MKPISFEKFQQHVANGDRVGFVLHAIRPEGALSDAEAEQRKAEGEPLKMVDGWYQPLSDADREQMARDAAAEIARLAEEAARPKPKSAEERIAELEAKIATLEGKDAAAPAAEISAVPAAGLAPKPE